MLNSCLVETEFVDWLQRQLNERGMDQAELTRRGNISSGQVSRVMSGQRGAGIDFLLGVARALRLAPEEVFRAAGVLPERVDMPDAARDWGSRLMALSEEDRSSVIAAMEDVLRYAENLVRRSRT